jgi:hypothetical protein
MPIVILPEIYSIVFEPEPRIYSRITYTTLLRTTVEVIPEAAGGERQNDVWCPENQEKSSRVETGGTSLVIFFWLEH